LLFSSAEEPPEDPALTPTEPAALSAPAPLPPRAAADRPESGALLEVILASLEDDKAEDVVVIDLRRRSTMADHMVIASGRSTRQVAAIASKLLDRLKERFRLIARVEGKEIGDWVLIDTGDVVVHVFRPEVRAFYQLEKMWQVPAGGGTAN
jgi:ribosome-associated protein